MSAWSDLQSLLRKDISNMTEEELQDYLQRVCDKIEELPIISKPNAKWLSVKADLVRCSQCSLGCHYRYNYCPNCGADMRGKE